MKEGFIMATNSFLKVIHVRDRAFAKKLIDALEHAKGKKSIEVKFSKPVKEIPKEEIKALFNKEND